MKYTYQTVKSNGNGPLNISNSVADSLDDLPNGTWVLTGGIRPSYLADDKKSGELFPKLPRYNTEQVKVIVQVMQPRFDKLNEVTTWYLEDIVPKMVDTFNNSQAPKIIPVR